MSRAKIAALFIPALLLVWSLFLQAAPQLGVSSLDDVIAAMTLEEKAGLVVGTGMDHPGLSSERRGPAVGNTNNRVPGSAGTTLAIPRLGIPAMVLADGPAGLRIQPKRETDSERTFYATAFPIATLLASSWDTDLSERVGAAIGHEAKEYGVDILLAPALNIQRFPLGGRNFEYYSEDPLLSGKMAAAMIRGVQSQGVGTAIKHFVANNHEWNRYSINVKAGERALREIYLYGFEIAVKEGKPWTVMSSYNKVNGTYTSESDFLLTDVLRSQWGFKGFVMTDWFGGQDTLAQLKAGNNLLMPGTHSQYTAVIEAVKSGALDEAVLDNNVAAILRVMIKTPAFKDHSYTNEPDLLQNAKIARTAAAEGMVLLHNKQQTLPIPRDAKLALFGNHSYDLITGGTGSGDVNEAYSVSLLQGLVQAGYPIHQPLVNTYNEHLSRQQAAQPDPLRFMLPAPLPELTLSDENLAEIVNASDIAIITLGRNSGEFSDREANNDFYLRKSEHDLIDKVSHAFHQKWKKVVVILNIGGVIEVTSWRDQVDAILLTWQPGQEAGHAIADVISGKVNPSGKLATTFATVLDDYPAAANFPGVVLEPGDPTDRSPMASAKAAEIVYKDDIWVGYRHFNRHHRNIAYPFGFGLSYTEFVYSGLTLSSKTIKEHMTLTVTAKITNNGNFPGKEVVQAYISAADGSLKKPEAELRAFAKTQLLQSKQSQTLSFEFALRDFASFNEDAACWVVEPGKYSVDIAASSTDVRLTADFHIVEKVTLPP